MRPSNADVVGRDDPFGRDDLVGRDHPAGRADSDGRGIRIRGGSRRLLRGPAPVAAALTLSACSALGLSAPTPTPTATTPAGPATVETLAPTTAATTASPTGGGRQSIATLDGGNGMAKKLVLDDKAVPAGWQDSTPRETGGYRMSVCGVDLEPNAPLDGAQKRWQYSASGPFLEQHVRVYTGGAAAAVVARLKKAVPGCTTYTSTEGGSRATYQVQKLTVPGADGGIVTWRQRLRLPAPAPATSPTATTGEASPSRPTTPTTTATAAPTAASPAAGPELVQDVAVTRRGSSVVLLASYAVNQSPQPEVLATAVRALGPSK